jgi:hypothetical protein
MYVYILSTLTLHAIITLLFSLSLSTLASLSLCLPSQRRQTHGYKTKLDSDVVGAHLRPTDALFVDYLLCRNATLFVGNSKSKISKQIVGLREAIDLPSFVLKADPLAVPESAAAA